MSCNCGHHEEEVSTPPTAKDVRQYSKECKINEIYEAIFEEAAKQNRYVVLSAQPKFVLDFFEEKGFKVVQEFNECTIGWEE